MSDTTIRGNATRRGPDAKRFAFFMPGPPRQLLKIFTCYLWGTHASRTKRATMRHSPSPSSALRAPLHLFSQTPFPPLFLRLHPFFCFAVPCGTAYFARRPLLLPPLSAPVGNPADLPATSREFYKTFHASLTASASFPPTKQRILVWIEFLMDPTPPGPRLLTHTHTYIYFYIRLFPFLSPVLARELHGSVATFFFLYRFLRGT